MILRLAFIALLLASPSALLAAENDREVAARNIALDLAGAFSNDGFKIRDGHWAGAIKQGEQAVLTVNLYAGNQYWFSVGADESAKKFALQIFDENGKAVSTENFEDEERAADRYYEKHCPSGSVSFTGKFHCAY